MKHWQCIPLVADRKGPKWAVVAYEYCPVRGHVDRSREVRSADDLPAAVRELSK